MVQLPKSYKVKPCYAVLLHFYFVFRENITLATSVPTFDWCCVTGYNTVSLLLYNNAAAPGTSWQ